VWAVVPKNQPKKGSFPSLQLFIFDPARGDKTIFRMNTLCPLNFRKQHEDLVRHYPIPIEWQIACHEFNIFGIRNIFRKTITSPKLNLSKWIRELIVRTTNRKSEEKYEILIALANFVNRE